MYFQSFSVISRYPPFEIIKHSNVTPFNQNDLAEIVPYAMHESFRIIHFIGSNASADRV